MENLENFKKRIESQRQNQKVSENFKEELNERSKSKKDILLNAKKSAGRIQSYIQKLRDLDKSQLSQSDKIQVSLTDKILKTELILLNINIGKRDWEFLGAFRMYSVLL